MERFPSADSRAKCEAAEQRKWELAHRTEQATSLTEVMTHIRDLAAARYEVEGIGRFEFFSFDFFLSKLTDFEFTGTPEFCMRDTAVTRALHDALDVIINQLFDVAELAWFVRDLKVNGDRCSLGVDIAIRLPFQPSLV